MTQRSLKVCYTNNVRIIHSPCLHSFDCDVIKMLSVNDMKTSREIQELLKGEKLRWCLKIWSENCVNKMPNLLPKTSLSNLSILPPLNPIRWKLFSSFQLFSVLFAFIRKFGIYCQNKHTHTQKLNSSINFHRSIFFLRLYSFPLLGWFTVCGQMNINLKNQPIVPNKTT